MNNPMTGRPRLLLTRTYPAAVEARARRDYEAELNPEDTPYGPDELIARAAGKDALLLCSPNRLTAETIAGLPASVRIAATFSVGTDHIDLDAARARGLVVTNTPDVLTDATAEIALLLMLGAARRAYEGERLVREAAWTGWTPTQLMGVELMGRRLAIIGMGRIGQALARRARACGMEIHYHNRRRLPADEEAGATYHDSVEGILEVADVVSLHCPATPETQHLINARTIELLPEGAIVVNTARGAVVDDEALIAALKRGRVRAAGLDVFEGEPQVNPGYLDLANTFLLPHLGSATVETRNAMGFRALDNLDAYFRGDSPPDRVA